MDAHDNVRTPFLEYVARVFKAFAVQEAALFGPYLVDGPVEVLHPMLLVLKDPVIYIYQPLSDPMRILDRPYRADSNAVPMPKLLKSIRNGLSRRAVAAARIGRDDQNFRCSLRHRIAFS